MDYNCTCVLLHDRLALPLTVSLVAMVDLCSSSLGGDYEHNCHGCIISRGNHSLFYETHSSCVHQVSSRSQMHIL